MVWKGARKGLERLKDESERVKSLSRVQLFATPWTIAHQAPLSMGFSRQEYWSGLPDRTRVQYREFRNEVLGQGGSPGHLEFWQWLG